MKKDSARTLTWFAVILALVGWLVMYPAGACALFALAAIVAAVPVFSGRSVVRVAAALVLLASVVSAAVKYPESRHELEMYKNRAKKVSQKG